MFSLVDQQFEEVDGGARTMALEYTLTAKRGNELETIGLGSIYY
jgi:hypothetical protein